MSLEEMNELDISTCDSLSYVFEDQIGCDGQMYNDPNTSFYKIPLESGIEFSTGLTNCSSSYHGSGQPDQYAFDFNLPEGTPFYASRGGSVVRVIESASGTGGAGNSLVIDHGDATFGMYWHSPKDGIHVEVGDQVVQGEQLGLIGSTGLAGYPHLHFIVVSESYSYPYIGTPVSFSNVIPPDVILQSNSDYFVCEN